MVLVVVAVTITRAENRDIKNNRQQRRVVRLTGKN